MIQCVGWEMLSNTQSVCAEPRALQRKEINWQKPPKERVVLFAPDLHHGRPAGDARSRSVGRRGQTFPILADVNDALRVGRNGPKEVEHDLPACMQISMSQLAATHGGTRR